MAYDSYTTGSYGGYSAGSAGSLKPPSKQTPANPNGYYCDIQSWNRAVDAGLDPRVNGSNLDFNQHTVNQIYDSMYASADTDKPLAGSKGFGFMSSGTSATSDPTHMVYYEYDGGGTIKVWDPRIGSGCEVSTWKADGSVANQCTWVALPAAK